MVAFCITDRYPQLPEGAPKLKIKRGRHYADDDVAFAVDLNGLAHQVGIGAVLASPQAVAKNNYVIPARLLLFDRKVATNPRRNSEHREEVRRYADARDLLRFGYARHIVAASRRVEDRHLFKYIVLTLPLQENGSGSYIATLGGRPIHPPHQHY